MKTLIAKFVCARISEIHYPYPYPYPYYYYLFLFSISYLLLFAPNVHHYRCA